MLTKEEKDRYSRQIVLTEVGESGQLRLKNSSVLVVGMGGLGCPASLALAACGIGKLIIMDDDKVSASNLARQTLYSESDLNCPKVEVAKKRLLQVNPYIEITAIEKRVTKENVEELVKNVDLVLDGSDNLHTRYLLNDTCAKNETPYVWASVTGSIGYVSVFNHKDGPCYRCLYPNKPKRLVQNCADAGVFSYLPGIIGQIQVREVVSILLKVGSPLVGRLLRYNAVEGVFKESKLSKDPNCKACNKSISFDSPDYEDDSICSDMSLKEINAEEYLDLKKVKNDLLLVDVREESERSGGYFMKDAMHLPMSGGAEEFEKLDKSKPIVVYCEHGIRSLNVAQYLSANGASEVYSLSGGLAACPELVDK